MLLLRPLRHCYHTHREAAARLVLNHSSHVEGLLPALRRVIEELPPPKLATVVPGRIAVTRGKAMRLNRDWQIDSDVSDGSSDPQSPQKRL